MKNITDLKNAFGKADDDFRKNVHSILARLQEREHIMDNGSAAKPERQAPRGLTRRFALIAVTVLLTLTATTFAFAYYFGSFDRLRVIVGDEVADTLQPVEISNVREGYIINTGFRVELVAVGVSSNIIDLYLTLEDLESNRLDGDIRVWAYVRQAGQWDSRSISQFSDIIDRTDDGIVTLHRREVFTHEVDGQELEFRLENIEYDFRTGELTIDFDLSAATEQMPVARLWDTPILPPHLHDIEVSLDGFENAGFISISSVGIIDGRLHIQEQYDIVALHRWYGNKVSLVDPRGEIISPLFGTHDNTASVSFRIDEQGDFYNNRGFNFVSDFPYRENIFEVDLGRLSEYRLVAFFDAHAMQSLSWAVRFEVDVPDVPVEFLIADGLDIRIGHYSSTITEVQITPHSVILKGEQGLHLDDPETPDNALISMPNLHVHINMVDGSVVDIMPGWISMDAETRRFTEGRHIEAGFIDLNSVVSIEINGEVIEFR